MRELITWNWRASEKTRNTLIKQGWSDEQRKQVLLTFIERYLNQEIEQASTKYFNMVKSSGIPHNAPKPDRAQEIAQDKKRAEDITNKPENASERLDELRKQIEPLTDDQAKDWIAMQRNTIK